MYKGMRFRGYKAFESDKYTQLGDMPRVSVIIGKNNSGKSSVLDVVGMMYDKSYALREQIESCAEEIVAEIAVTRELCDELFNGYTSIDSYTSGTLWNISKGCSIGFRLEPDNSGGSIVDWNDRLPLWNSSHSAGVVRDIVNERERCVFRHVAAERNIVPEAEGELGGTLEDLTSTGEGASNIIREFLNNSRYDESVIEDSLLNAVNEIMSPEAEFESIEEFDDMCMMSWVTKGKEIENYIPYTAIQEAMGVTIPEQCGQYELFPSYIEPYYHGFVGKKVKFARMVAAYMTMENMTGMLDVNQRIRDLGERIVGWNGL